MFSNFMLAMDSSAFLLFAFIDGLHFILGADSDDCWNYIWEDKEEEAARGETHYGGEVHYGDC